MKKRKCESTHPHSQWLNGETKGKWENVWAVNDGEDLAPQPNGRLPRQCWEGVFIRVCACVCAWSINVCTVYYIWMYMCKSVYLHCVFMCVYLQEYNSPYGVLCIFISIQSNSYILIYIQDGSNVGLQLWIHKNRVYSSIIIYLLLYYFRYN